MIKQKYKKLINLGYFAETCPCFEEKKYNKIFWRKQILAYSISFKEVMKCTVRC